MPGCRRFLVAGALTLAVLGGTTGTGIADEADRGKTGSCDSSVGGFLTT